MSREILKNFYEKVQARFPNGTGRRGLPVNIGGVKLRFIIFPGEYQVKDKVQYGLFKWAKRYSRKTIAVSAKGSVFEDTSGIITPMDLTSHEPDFGDASSYEIALQVAKQVIPQIT